MQAFLVSTGLVALAEIGDKTQLLSLILSARYRRPWPIVFGILIATLANHALAASVGAVIMRALGPDLMRWILAISFLGMAGWALIPDELNKEDTLKVPFGVFGTTALAFFLAEMGDKTQVATVALAAQYSDLYGVIGGTTLGMLTANVPVVLLGDRATRRVRLRAIRAFAAALFVILGLLALFDAGSLL